MSTKSIKERGGIPVEPDQVEVISLVPQNFGRINWWDVAKFKREYTSESLGVMFADRAWTWEVKPRVVVIGLNNQWSEIEQVRRDLVCRGLAPASMNFFKDTRKNGYRVYYFGEKGDFGRRQTAK